MNLDIIRQVDLGDQTDESPVFYLPHHTVVRESNLTTKVCPPFDASLVITKGLSMTA